MHELVNKRHTLFTCSTEPRKQTVKRLTCVKRKEINNRIWLLKKNRGQDTHANKEKNGKTLIQTQVVKRKKDVHADF